jgi:hypothetical protein
MGIPQRLGTIPLAIFTDASNNIGIGGSPSGSYKFEVTGTVRVSGVATFSSTAQNAFLINSTNTDGPILQIQNSGNNLGLIGNAEGITNGGATNFAIRATNNLIFSTGGANPRMTITSSGQVLIGTTSTLGGGILGLNGNLEFGGTAGGNYRITNYQAGFLAFDTDNTERMRITSGGYTKISNTGSYEYVNASIHEVRNSAADWILYGTNPHASSPSGYYISYPAASPNNTSNFFIACADSSAARFRVASNGNCYNVTGTYTSGVSDIRYKEQVTDANSQWDDIKNLRVVNFKFKKDVEENGENALKHIGFIAQEVEKTSPHLIEEMSDEKTGETWKTIKASIIHTKAIKALQEAMAKIEELEAKVSALENKA